MASREGQPRTHLFKKRLKSSYVTGSNSTQIVQNLRVTNKCLSLRLRSVRESLQQKQKYNVQLIKQNSELKKQIQELKQNPLIDRFTEVKEHIYNLKNKMFILSSVASGAAETIVELAHLFMSVKSAATGIRSDLTTSYSLLNGIADISLADAAVSVDSESTLKMAFPDVMKPRRSHKQRQLLRKHCQQKLCPGSSDDDTAVNRDCTESWSFCDVVASASPSTVCNCEIKHVSYMEKHREPESCLTKPTAQYEKRKKIHSAQKNQMLEAWVAASRLHTDVTTPTSEVPLLKSWNSFDENLQSTCNHESVSQNSPNLTEADSPVTPNQERKVGLQQENKPKSRLSSVRKDIGCVTVPHPGNVRSSKRDQKSAALKKRPLSRDKFKLKKYNSINNATNRRFNGKLWGLTSPAAYNKDTNNTEASLSKANSYKVSGQENAAKPLLLTDLSNRLSKSPIFKKAAKKVCKNSSSVFPKSRKQQSAENSPVFLNGEKHKLKFVLNMPADELTFSLPLFKNTNETLPSTYETCTVDRLSEINLCAISNKHTQLDESLVHGKIVKDSYHSVGEDFQSGQHAQDSKLNDCENSKTETSKGVCDEGSSLPSSLICPPCIKIDNQERANNDFFQKRYIEKSVDDGKQTELSAEMSNDYNNEWLNKDSGEDSTELCEYTECKHSDSNTKGPGNIQMSPLKDALLNRHNLRTGSPRKMNLPGNNADQNGIADKQAINTGNSKNCYTRPLSATLKTEKTNEVRGIARDVNIVSNSHPNKTNTFLKTVKRRPHSVASNRSQTNILDYKTRMKTKNTPIKSHFVAVNLAYGECEQSNTCCERKKERDNYLSPCTPINKPLKSKKKVKRVNRYALSKSVVSDVNDQLKNPAWLNCNAAVESRKTTAGKTATEESDISNKTLSVEMSEDDQSSNDGSDNQSYITHVVTETKTYSLKDIENTPGQTATNMKRAPTLSDFERPVKGAHSYDIPTKKERSPSPLISRLSPNRASPSANIKHAEVKHHMNVK